MNENLNENEISVAVIGDRGFWIKDNRFMTAILTENHEIDPEEAEQVDIYSIPTNQLGYLFRILDKIYEDQ